MRCRSDGWLPFQIGRTPVTTQASADRPTEVTVCSKVKVLARI